MHEEYPGIVALQERYGFRTVVNVPLMREGEAVGVISLAPRARGAAVHRVPSSRCCRRSPDQAVIAIENVRLLNETKEALERQTATARSAAGHQQLGGGHRSRSSRDPRQLPAPVRGTDSRDLPVPPDEARWPSLSGGRSAWPAWELTPTSTSRSRASFIGQRRKRRTRHAMTLASAPRTGRPAAVTGELSAV